MLCTPLRLAIDYLFGSHELQQFQDLAVKQRNETYFANFATVFSKNRDYPLEYCFWLPYSLRDDFTLLKKLTSQITEIEVVALEAMQRGFSCKALEEITGKVFDVPASFEEYTAILDSDCSICYEAFTMDDFTNQKIHRTACHHFFHSSAPCLAKWLEFKQTCPICRSVVCFSKEVKNWGRYLKKIDKAICEKFPKSMCDDRRLALQIQESMSSSMKSSSNSSVSKGDPESS